MRRLHRHWIAAIGLAAGFGLLAPGMALAHQADHQRGHERERSDRHVEQHRRHAPRPLLHHRTSHRQHTPYRSRHQVRVVYHSAFHCAPCNRSFRRQSAFRRHLHRAHHVSLHRIWHNLVHVAFGWVYYG